MNREETKQNEFDKKLLLVWGSCMLFLFIFWIAFIWGMIELLTRS